MSHDGFTLKDGAAADQRRVARTGLALLVLSAGTSMIAGGDEHLRSLHCNNNPYNLDSPENWLSYSFNTEETNFATFAERMLASRRAHPAVRPHTWYSPSDNKARPDYPPPNHNLELQTGITSERQSGGRHRYVRMEGFPH